MSANPSRDAILQGPTEALSAAALLKVWDEVGAASPTRRALTLLSHALPDASISDLAALPIGVRDRLLILLRGRQFGGSIDCVADCGACGETLEFPVRVDDLTTPTPPFPDTATVPWAGSEITVRPANSTDLLALDGLPEAERLTTLMRRCAAVQGDDALPDGAEEAVASAMASLDPGADLSFALTCPACGAEWESLFDIAAYFWTEVDLTARRLLPEVHVIARAYGWSEKDILALSPARRSSYLALISAG